MNEKDLDTNGRLPELKSRAREAGIPLDKVVEDRKNLAELKSELAANGMSTDGKQKDIWDRCVHAKISLVKARKDVVEGYVGKPKGIKQIAWERGFFTKQMLHNGEVSVEGLRKDENGVIVKQNDPRYKLTPIDLSTSLRYMLGQCKDFQEEITRLEWVAKGLGFSLTLTPKTHCEIAGVGIEYCWGYSKFHFRKANDCVVQNLEKNVAASLDKVTIWKARKFARKARDYKVVYIQQALGKLDELGYSLIEKMVKEAKTHRCSLDQEYKFITQA